ncbi:N-acetyl sugar amidotransferase [Methylocystis sp. FS]|uniref:N-acetyl sugar amidotransferase n=1 Tax=Methylocystis silviterrae TaxID=2743612 RepID=UPI0015825E52|nr:N-acetyl sugar amidotransferase [Methylocystis silviterrae]NUJ81641.1 N-acetyl sugar amidotransferase [Methylocystis silviterrae]
MTHLFPAETDIPGSARRRYRICTKLVIDTSDPEVTFDEEGVSNYWHEHQAFLAKQPNAESRAALLEATVKRLRTYGQGRKYDCILGLSGGVDSSYLAWLAVKLGLRPLLVHFDNGWNSELAVSNIEQICRRLRLPLHTFVMDWPEFRDLQRAYFKASVLDLEVPTDHMIFGALYKVARQNSIRFILSGNNHRTEWLLPREWYYRKFDLVSIKGIHRRYGELPMKRLPALGVWQSAWYQMRFRMQDIKLLDLVDYRKQEAKDLLMSELGWRDYGGKHYESIFTRFYQGYILPRKYGIDKRRAHLSNLILSQQMTREQALAELQQPTYDPQLQEEDKIYVAKKLGFSGTEFEDLLKLPGRRHEEFGTDERDLRLLREFMGWIRPITTIAKKGGWRVDN